MKSDQSEMKLSTGNISVDLLHEQDNSEIKGTLPFLFAGVTFSIFYQIEGRHCFKYERALQSTATSVMLKYHVNAIKYSLKKEDCKGCLET